MSLEKLKNGKLLRRWHDQHFSKTDDAACLTLLHYMFVAVWSRAIATCVDRYFAEFVHLRVVWGSYFKTC